MKDAYEIWYHPDGILLHMDTYNGNTRNTSTIDYCWRPFDENNYPVSIIGSRKAIPDGPHQICGSLDVREGVRHKLNQLRTHGEFIKPWFDHWYSWLGHYSKNEYNLPHEKFQKLYRERAAQVLAQLPQEVLDCIGPYRK
jgi:hypothetical protein